MTHQSASDLLGHRSLYPSTEVMANLMTYNDTVSMERCSGFIIVVTYSTHINSRVSASTS